MSRLPRRIGLPIGVFGAAIALAGCGGGSLSGIAAATAPALKRDVAAVTAAAKAHNYAGAGTALATLGADVWAARARGELSAQRAQRILTAAGYVVADVQAIAASTPSSSPSPPRTAVTSQPPRQVSQPSRAQSAGGGGDRGGGGDKGGGGHPHESGHDPGGGGKQGGGKHGADTP